MHLQQFLPAVMVLAHTTAILGLNYWQCLPNNLMFIPSLASSLNPPNHFLKIVSFLQLSAQNLPVALGLKSQIFSMAFTACLNLTPVHLSNYISHLSHDTLALLALEQKAGGLGTCCSFSLQGKSRYSAWYLFTLQVLTEDLPFRAALPDFIPYPHHFFYTKFIPWSFLRWLQGLAHKAKHGLCDLEAKEM